MIEKKTIILKDWPQRVWERQRNVLILTLWKDMLLLSYPPLCGFYATTAEKARFARLVNVFVMAAVSITASIFFRAKSSGTAREHFGDLFNDDGTEGFSVLLFKSQLVREKRAYFKKRRVEQASTNDMKYVYMTLVEMRQGNGISTSMSRRRPR